MKKSLVTMLIAFCFLGVVALASAQSSSTVRTRVGNPPTQVGGDGLLALGNILKNAYDTCSSGDTHEPPASLQCLERELVSQGLSQVQISMYRQNRGRLVESPQGRNSLCLQCLGFIQTVFSIYSNALMPSYGSPKNMINLQTLSAGGVTFRKMPQGTSPQPGDIGVHGSGSYGHIVIVQEPIGNVRFKALESNGRNDCRITNDRDLLIDQYGYVFFREE